ARLHAGAHESALRAVRPLPARGQPLPGVRGAAGVLRARPRPPPRRTARRPGRHVAGRGLRLPRRPPDGLAVPPAARVRRERVRGTWRLRACCGGPACNALNAVNATSHKARLGAFLARNPFPLPYTFGFFYREKMRAIHRVAPDRPLAEVLEVGGGRSGTTALLFPGARVTNLDMDASCAEAPCNRQPRVRFVEG